MSDTPRTVAWFKHGPYADGDKVECVTDDPNDDVCHSPLVFLSDYETLKADLAAANAKLAALERENSKLRSALEIVHFKQEPWQ